MCLSLIFFLPVFAGCIAALSAPLTRNGFHLNRTKSIADAELFRELHRRNGPLVNTASIPSGDCYPNDCNLPRPFATPLIPQCHLIPLESCPPDSGYSECYSWNLDCFCNAPEPLWCAWGCTWDSWFAVEDWFTKACPQTPPVDFSPLPACAQDCISTGSFNYGCITSSSSCFCLFQNLFDCPAQCSDPADIQKITDWYQSTCQWPEATTAEIVKFGLADTLGGKHRSGASIKTTKAVKLHWYEILIIVTAVFTAVAAVVCTIVLCVLRRSPKFQAKRSAQFMPIAGVSTVDKVKNPREPSV